MSASPAPDVPLSSRIGQIAGLLSGDALSTGDRAALRRTNPERPVSIAFYRFASRHLPETWDYDAEARKNWMTVVAGIALMSPDAHRPDYGHGLGRALATAKYSEARLERLLASEDDTRRVLLLRAARFLAAKSAPCNWVDAAQLLFIQDVGKREVLCRRIAKDFYTPRNVNEG